MENGILTINLSDGSSDEDEESSDDLITLNGCGQMTQWQFPADIKHCPVQNCRLLFGVRSDAINHYKKRHAKHSILCFECDKPIISHNAKYFTNHYRRIHPSIPLPFDFCEKVNKNVKKVVRKKRDTKMAYDDMITLSGCGVITQWHFPMNIKYCPARGCGKRFKARLNAINHYRDKHAHVCFLCTICDKPFAGRYPSDIKQHYKRFHSKASIPTIEKIPKNDNNDLNGIEDEDDLITLNGYGVVTQWRFPRNRTSCPNNVCNKNFDSRSDLIAHYQSTHAKNAILCDICMKPISSNNPANLRNHYKNMHPNHKIPYELLITNARSVTRTTDKRVECEICDKLHTSNNLSRQIAEVHNIQQICCPLVECTFETKQTDLLHIHWMKSHPNLRFPELKSNFTYKFNSTNDTSHETHEEEREIEENSESDATAQPEDTEPELLIPFGGNGDTPRSDESSSSEDETDIKCNKCGNQFRSVNGLRRHSMIKHNIHTFSPMRKSQKRKRILSYSSDDNCGISNLREPVIKKEVLVSGSSFNSSDDNIKLSEIITSNKQNEMGPTSNCKVVLDGFHQMHDENQMTNTEYSEFESETIVQPSTSQRCSRKDSMEIPPEYEDETDDMPLDLTLPKTEQAFDNEGIMIPACDSDILIISSDSEYDLSVDEIEIMFENT